MINHVNIKNIFLILTCILILTTVAGYFRFHNLGVHSLWFDEGLTYLRAFKERPINISVPYYKTFQIYTSIITHSSRNWLSEWELRLPGALLGTLAVPVFFILMSRRMGIFLGFILSLYLALSPFCINNAREARYYGPYLFLSIVVISLFLEYKKYLQTTGRFLLWNIVWIVFCTFLIGTHLTSGLLVGFLWIILGSVFIYNALRYRKKKYILYFLLFMTGIVPLIAANYNAFKWGILKVMTALPIETSFSIPDNTLPLAINGSAKAYLNLSVSSISSFIRNFGFDDCYILGDKQIILWLLLGYIILMIRKCTRLIGIIGFFITCITVLLLTKMPADNFDWGINKYATFLYPFILCSFFTPLYGLYYLLCRLSAYTGKKYCRWSINKNIIHLFAACCVLLLFLKPFLLGTIQSITDTRRIIARDRNGLKSVVDVFDEIPNSKFVLLNDENWYRLTIMPRLMRSDTPTLILNQYEIKQLQYQRKTFLIPWSSNVHKREYPALQEWLAEHADYHQIGQHGLFVLNPEFAKPPLAKDNIFLLSQLSLRSEFSSPCELGLLQKSFDTSISNGMVMLRYFLLKRNDDYIFLEKAAKICSQKGLFSIGSKLYASSALFSPIERNNNYHEAVYILRNAPVEIQNKYAHVAWRFDDFAYRFSKPISGNRYSYCHEAFLWLSKINTSRAAHYLSKEFSRGLKDPYASCNALAKMALSLKNYYSQNGNTNNSEYYEKQYKTLREGSKPNTFRNNIFGLINTVSFRDGYFILRDIISILTWQGLQKEKESIVPIDLNDIFNNQTNNLDLIHTVYLDELQPAWVSNMYGSVKYGSTFDGKQIRINNIVYTHGLATHPPASGSGYIAYTLNGKYNVFQSTIGVTANGTVQFFVYGDGKCLFKSSIINTNTPFETVDINITGINELILKIDKVDFNYSDHAIWADACVEY